MFIEPKKQKDPFQTDEHGPGDVIVLKNPVSLWEPLVLEKEEKGHSCGVAGLGELSGTVRMLLICEVTAVAHRHPHSGLLRCWSLN